MKKLEENPALKKRVESPQNVGGYFCDFVLLLSWNYMIVSSSFKFVSFYP